MIEQIGAPVLRTPARDVSKEEIASEKIQALIAHMIDVMRKAPGVGLAAPQIGEPYRIFVLEDRQELIDKLSDAERRERERVPFAPRVFINPTVTPVGDERAAFFEGCLSLNGYVGLVERALEVEVRGLDEQGVEQTWRVRGWPARILQHENDHLAGTIYVDRMQTRSFMQADHYKARFAGKPIAEIKRELAESETPRHAPAAESRAQSGTK